MEIKEKKLALLTLAVAATSLVISICSGVYVIIHKTVYVKIDSPFGKITGNLPAEELPIDFFSNKGPNEPNFNFREALIKVELRELELKEAVEIRRRKYVEDHPELSDFFKKVILDGSYAKGMTKEQCIASLGEPENINKGEIYEQFIYHGLTIYFESGIIVDYEYY
jgi:hypothetical protein